MKNYILIIAALCVASHVEAKVTSARVNSMKQRSAVELLAEFHRMEEEHKLDWLDFMAKSTNAKTTLLKNNKKEWVAFRNDQNKTLSGLTEFSESTKNAYFKEQLRSAIALHEKQVASWHRWSQDKNDEAKRLAAKHKAQLDAFKKQVSY